MLKRVAALAVLCLILVAGLVYSQRRSGPLQVSGFIESDEIRIGSRVGGRVLKVMVEEGQEVRQGQALIELDPFQLKELKAQSTAQLAQAQADYDRLLKGYQPEEIEQTKARLDQLVAARDRLADGEEDIAAAEANLQLARSELDLATLKY